MNTNIYINQLGYKVESNKYFLTTYNCDSFKIVSTTGKTVFSGDIELHSKKDKSTGERLYIGVFNDFKIPGSYFIELENGVNSFQFSIDNKIYNKLLSQTLKSFYYQRCGIALEERYANEFKRPACHCGETDYHPDIKLEGSKDVTGGWHDAGDYGRYITPGATAVSSMLIGYEMYPQKFQTVSNSLPENNGKPDFFNEVFYELNWMFKMQELDKSSDKYGALHYMVNSGEYCWAEPHKDDKKQYIMDYCSIATADFCAVMACASRLFKNIDSEFSKKALERSLLAWDFITNTSPYPEGGYVRPNDIHTGGYAESRENNIFHETHKLWPAVELFLTTGDESYHTLIKELFKDKSTSYGQMSWSDKTGFAELKYLLASKDNTDIKLRGSLKKNLKARCEYFISNSKKSGFNTVLNENEYYWGSNSEIFSRVIQLLVGYKLDNISEYEDTALYQLNYILGLNIHNMSFISGLGTNYTKHIHHASFDNDGIDYNFPGMMPGGANKSVEVADELFDKALYKKCPPGTPAAKCYIDDVESFSSNENCITYTAPLISVAAYFSS